MKKWEARKEENGEKVANERGRRGIVEGKICCGEGKEGTQRWVKIRRVAVEELEEARKESVEEGKVRVRERERQDKWQSRVRGRVKGEREGEEGSWKGKRRVWWKGTEEQGKGEDWKRQSKQKRENEKEREGREGGRIKRGCRREKEVLWKGESQERKKVGRERRESYQQTCLIQLRDTCRVLSHSSHLVLIYLGKEKKKKKMGPGSDECGWRERWRG